MTNELSPACDSSVDAVLGARDRFELTVNGLVNATDTSKKYLVIEIEGEQAKLYQSIKAAILLTFRSPRTPLGEIEPNILCLREGVACGISVPRIFRSDMVYDVTFNIIFRFKDGKIRIDAPEFMCNNISAGKSFQLVINEKMASGFERTIINTIFNKKGALENKEAKKAVEEFFNGLIDKLLMTVIEVQKDDW